MNTLNELDLVRQQILATSIWMNEYRQILKSEFEFEKTELIDKLAEQKSNVINLRRNQEDILRSVEARLVEELNTKEVIIGEFKKLYRGELENLEARLTEELQLKEAVIKNLKADHDIEVMKLREQYLQTIENLQKKMGIHHKIFNKLIKFLKYFRRRFHC